MEKDIIQEQFDLLPTEIQRVLESVEWRNLVKNIASRIKLDPQKAIGLETEVMLVLYGFAPAEELLSNLINKLSLDEATASQLESLINREVFEEFEKQFEKIKGNVSKESLIAPSQNKKMVMEELSQRVARARENGASISPKAPAKVPDLHPMIEEGEKVHDVPHLEPTTNNLQPTTEPSRPILNQTPTAQVVEPLKSSPAPAPEKSKIEPPPSQTPPPGTGYPDGQDPYREPLK